jgi:hypothetical protein
LANTLLLISQKPEDQPFAAEVATAAGLSLKTVPQISAAIDMISKEEATVIFADVTEEKDFNLLEATIQETIGLFSDKINANTLHFISNNDLQKVKFNVQSPIFGNYVVREFGDTAEGAKKAGQYYGRIVRASLQERAFGLQNYLAAGAKVQTVQFKNTNQKQAGVEAIKNYLLGAQFKGRQAAIISNAVDEILMNAMFDAPVDAGNRQLHASVARSTALPLEGKQAVEMRVGWDGERVGISVSDQFGSLDRGRFLAHVSKRYKDDQYKLKTVVAGAGVGLATVFANGGSLIFISESGVRTEAMVFFERTPNFRQFKDQFRFLFAQFYF